VLNAFDASDHQCADETACLRSSRSIGRALIQLCALAAEQRGDCTRKR
jgi:hypothetical protein